MTEPDAQSVRDPDPTLPLPIEQYYRRAIGGCLHQPKRVVMHQKGQMRQGPGQRWMPWTAVETFEVERVAFAWKAKFPMVPLMWMRVVDRYDAGHGALDGKLWGALKVIHEDGPEAALGQAMRYLAELPWVPHAFEHNRQLRWYTRSEHEVDVATVVGEQEARVTLTFDDVGDIVKVHADARPRTANERRPWGGEFSDYDTMAGLRIPKHAEVYWELDGERFDYWRGDVVSVELET